jgi:hypothetical protein
MLNACVRGTICSLLVHVELSLHSLYTWHYLFNQCTRGTICSIIVHVALSVQSMYTWHYLFNQCTRGTISSLIVHVELSVQSLYTWHYLFTHCTQELSVFCTRGTICSPHENARHYKPLSFNTIQKANAIYFSEHT